MAKAQKTFEDVELSSGKTVNITVTVVGSHESNYGADADGNRGVSTWIIEGHSHDVECEDDLDESDHEEIGEKVEEFVDEESWDFNEDWDDEDEEEDELF